MKFAIGRINTSAKDTLTRPMVDLPEASFVVGNPEVLAKTRYPLMVLCRYDPEDQFANIITMETVEQAMKALTTAR